MGVFISLLVVSAIGAAATNQERPDFSGTWVFNPEKSRLEVKVKPESGTFTIDHKEPEFRFSRVFVIGGKPDEHSYALRTDGKEDIRTEGGRTTHSRLYWDGEALVFNVRYVLTDGREATNVVRYSLRDNGSTFVAEEKFRGPVLKYDNLWVADRTS
jgi:hypothetical protein